MSNETKKPFFLRGRYRSNALHTEEERLRFSAEIPGGSRGPLWKIAIEAHSEPDAAGGERMRIRAHIQTNLASVARPALAALGKKALERLPAPAAEAASGALAPIVNRASHWLERRVQAAAPRIARLAEPLLRNDVNTWFELHASTAPLVQGAKALLPNASKLSQLGIQPNDGPNAPPVQAWQGQIGNEAAQVSLLRIDESHLPDNLKDALGGKPFQLAAAMVNVVTRKD